MKILHTSDWHIGKRLYDRDTENEHRQFFDWLIETINQKKVDLLLVSGDIFDIAYPSNSSLQLYYRTLTRIANSYCKHVIITGGNHDSVSTMNAPRQILEMLQMHVVGGVTDDLKDEIIEIRNENEQTELVVCAVPFLRDRDIRKSVPGETIDEKNKQMRDGIIAHYQQLADEVNSYHEQKIPIIAMGHLFMAGASTSDSEREIYIGNLEKLTNTNFPDIFDYVALGHIHRPQKIGGSETIRYSGSPIPLSFSERNDTKEIVLLDFQNNKLQNIESLHVPEFRKLMQIKGTLEGIILKLEAVAENDNTWYEIFVQEQEYDPTVIQRFEKFMDQKKQLEILHYRVLFDSNQQSINDLYVDAPLLKDLKETEVFERLIESVKIDDKNTIKEAFSELLLSMNDS